MNKKIAFLTTIFPMKEEYLYDFFNSLNRQTYKKFDVIVVNDGYKNIKKIRDRFKKLNIIELKYSSTPSKNREYGINFVRSNGYDVLIFGDSDDYFSSNRVKVSIDKLNRYDIVVNDLSLFNSIGIYDKSYISNRLPSNSVIKKEYVIDKNMFGMSNTAVNVSILFDMDVDDKLKVLDWYLFTNLLFKGYKAIFTGDTETFYRQYSNNIVGIGKLTNKLILEGLHVKLKHYNLLQNVDVKLNKLYCSMIELQEKIKDLEYLEKLKDQSILNPLWWEEIKLIEVKDENKFNK